MSRYALIKYDVIKGRCQFFKLVIDPVIENGKIVSYKRCEYDEFCTQIRKKSTFRLQIDKLVSLMQLFAEGEPLPITKYNPNLGIDGAAEFKAKDLRLYIFHYHSIGYIIVCGGKKSTQPQDISHLSFIITQIRSNHPIKDYEYQGRTS